MIKIKLVDQWLLFNHEYLSITDKYHIIKYKKTGYLMNGTYLTEINVNFTFKTWYIKPRNLILVLSDTHCHLFNMRIFERFDEKVWK